MNIVYAMTKDVYSWILPSLRSLAEHNPDAHVFIVCEDDELPLDLPVKADVINITGQQWFPKDGPNYKNYFTYINLLKVRYPSILPETVDRVIHLDVDTIVCQNLEPLFNMDLAGKWFAARPENYPGHYTLIGDTYYNAGVLVLNLDQMRRDGIEQKMQDYLNGSRQPYADQNAWNYFGITENKAVPLDSKWNESMVTGYTDNPGIIHYCGIRDWYTQKNMYRGEYLQKYKKSVLFASTKPLERAQNIKAVYDAYKGEKSFVQVDPWRRHPEIQSGNHKLLVIDEFPTESPGQVLYIGHGFHGCKLGGLDSPHPYHSVESAKLISCAVASGDGVVAMMASQCGIPESKVFVLGASRSDAYVGKKKGDGGTEFANYRTYYYLPTYRSREETSLPEIDWQWLDDHLADDELLAVRHHPMTGSTLKGSYRHIKEYSHELPYMPYLFDCDVVITDYSSAMIEGYLLDKPCVLFEKVKGYTETRGMYLDYPEAYSSRYAMTEQEMLELARSADKLTQTELACRELLAGACDGHSTERICELIRSLI